MKNLGYSYYKEYFNNLEFNRETNGKYTPSLKKAETKNFVENLFKSNFHDYKEQIPSVEVAVDEFELTTIYPGLLIGSGYNHEIGKQENELKLGIFFDYTTGLPCIPGSSVKGVLRDACEKAKGKYAISILNELKNGERKPLDKNKIAIEQLSTENLQAVFNGEKNSEFVQMVFAGIKDRENHLSFKERDIFFDAFPTNSLNTDGKFLANDYITPHKHPTNPKLDPFTSPTPIQFLKILPQVTFQFNFRLTKGCIPKEVKLELFRQILLDLGVGAKTNVGYGQLTDNISIGQISNSENKTQELNENTISKHIIPNGVKLKKNEEYKATVVSLGKNHACFKFSKDGKDCLVSKKLQTVYEKLKKKGYEGELKIGEEVTVKIQEDYLNTSKEVSFQVLIPKNIN
jgi:CRISPR-associated protein Cmr6